MKSFCFRVYNSCRRSLGHYGILLSLIAVGSLYHGWTQGFDVGPLPFAALIVLGAGVTMSVPRLTPNWLANPNGLVKGLLIFVGSGPLALLYGIVAISVVAPFGLPVPVGKMLTLVIAFPALAYWTAMSFAALFCAILPDKGQTDPEAQSITSVPSEQPRTNTDLRSIRHSRMKV